jgi:tetrapyrrole methylase family protein / MazG family protein
MNNLMINPSLIVVGSGIKFISHLTVEAQAHIAAADKILYLVNEPAMQAWLSKNYTNAESLDNLYFKSNLRIDAYQEITTYILENLDRYAYVCVVIYGHPTVFAKPALDAVILARQKGYRAEILPGISAEDCLFADLLIDPGTSGCLSLEATLLLAYRKQIDISCHIILWQIGVIGTMGHAKSHNNTKGIILLTEYLKGFYGPNYEITLYKASQYAGFKPSINKVKLHQLPSIEFPTITTLYIPPAIHPNVDINMLTALGITTETLQIKAHGQNV